MAHFYISCLLATLCVAFVAVSGTTIEIYDGTYYGIEDVGGVTTIQVSRQNGTESWSDDGVTVRPLPPDSNRDHTRRGDGPPNRRGHHHRGRHGGHHHHHHHHGHHGDEAPEGSHNYGRMPFMRGDLMANWTEEQKLTQICGRLQAHSERGRHHTGMLESKLRQMNEQDRQKIVDLWTSRKQAMRRCCGMNTVNEKLQCVNELRTARYERVCRGEEPLCPWSRYGSDHGNFAGNVPPISNTTSTCCSRQGAERLQCFVDAKHDYRQRLIEFMSRGPPSPHGTAQAPHPDARRHRRPEDRGDGRPSHRGGRKNRPHTTTVPPA